MSRLPDLVIDSKLETRINQEYTVHVYSDVDPALRSLTVEREERWQQKRSIGRGRFGDVFLEKCVQGIRQGELRAVKRIPRPKKELEYVRELEAIAKFSHSKYVHYFVKSYGWFHAAYDICIAMEYLPLGDLNKYLMESSSPLPEAETGQIVYQILSGISLMHENGYVHRDLKPSNILICSTPPEGWWVKIADFGISKRAENVTLTASTTKGTPGYMAPELQGFLSSKNSSKPSCSVDMWSLGEITFRMLTKKTVFDSPYDLFLYATTQQPLPTAPLVRAKVSEDSIHFIEHCMMVDPDLRFSAQQGLQCSWIMPLIPSSSEASLPDLTSSIHAVQKLDGKFESQPELSPQAQSESGLWHRISTSRYSKFAYSSNPKFFYYPTLLISLENRDTSGDSIQINRPARLLYFEEDTFGFFSPVFSFNGNFFAPLFDYTITSCTSVTVWNTASGTLHATLNHPGPNVDILSMAFIYDEDLLALCQKNGQHPKLYQVRNLSNGHIINLAEDLSSNRIGFYFSPNGLLLAQLSSQTIQLWATNSGTLIHSLILEPFEECFALRFGHEDRVVVGLQVEQDDLTFIKVYDVKAGAWIISADYSNSRIPIDFRALSSCPLQLSCNAQWLAIYNEDVNNWHLWNLRELPARGQQFEGRVYWVSFSCDSKLIAAYYKTPRDSIIRVYKTSTGNLLHTAQAPWLKARGRFLPDGRLVVLGFPRKQRGLGLWDLGRYMEQQDIWLQRRSWQQGAMLERMNFNGGTLFEDHSFIQIS